MLDAFAHYTQKHDGAVLAATNSSDSVAVGAVVMCLLSVLCTFVSSHSTRLYAGFDCFHDGNDDHLFPIPKRDPTLP